MKSIGLSVFTLHSGTMFDLTQGEFLQWQSGVYKGLPQALVRRNRDGAVPHYTHYQLAEMMQSPMPMELLYLNPLRLWVHIVKSGDEHMIAALLENKKLDRESSWLRGVYHALKWMQQQIGEENVPEELFDLDHVQPWGEFQPAAREIKQLIKEAETLPLM